MGKPESQMALSNPWRNQTGTVLATSWKSFAMRHIKPTLIVLGFSRRVKLLSCWEIRAVYMSCSICLNKVLWMLVLVIGCISYIYIFITYVSNGSIITIYEPIYVVFVCCIHENHVIKTWTSDFFVQGSGLLHWPQVECGMLSCNSALRRRYHNGFCLQGLLLSD